MLGLACVQVRQPSGLHEGGTTRVVTRQYQGENVGICYWVEDGGV